MRIIFVSLLLFISAFAFAQERQYSTTNKDAIKYYALAAESLDEHLYDDAVAKLQKAINADTKFIEAHMQLGDLFRQMHKHTEATKEFAKVIELNPEFNRGVYLKIGD